MSGRNEKWGCGTVTGGSGFCGWGGTEGTFELGSAGPEGSGPASRRRPDRPPPSLGSGAPTPHPAARPTFRARRGVRGRAGGATPWTDTCAGGAALSRMRSRRLGPRRHVPAQCDLKRRESWGARGGVRGVQPPRATCTSGEDRRGAGAGPFQSSNSPRGARRRRAPPVPGEVCHQF